MLNTRLLLLIVIVTAQANAGRYLAATHVNGSLLGPTNLYPGSTTPAKPGEIVVLYANGFGPTSTPVVNGSASQSGTLSPLPVVKIGGVPAIAWPGRRETRSLNSRQGGTVFGMSARPLTLVGMS